MANARHAPTDHARNYCEIAYQFAREAAADRKGRKHNKWVRLAAKRHLDDLTKQRRKDFGYTFDEWHGNDVCDFAEKFPHVEGAWDSPTIVLEPPQIFILVTVFGWRRKTDHGRRFSAVYIEMARKGAKSTLTAVIANYCLACEDEVGPKIIIGATTGDQANKVFEPAKQMAERTPDYLEAFGVEVWARSISCSQNGGYIQPINAKSSTQDGWNPHVGILDELHAHKDRGIYDVIRSAAGARRNFLLWMITTAGYNVEGVCYEQRTMVTKILEGVIQADHYFGIIFTIDEGDDPLDEKVWIKANPMIGITPSWDSMRSHAAEAKASPDSMGEFKTKKLNVWTNAKHAWLNMEQWKRGGGAVTDEAISGVPCWAGLDLASVSDIAAWVLAWWVDGRLKVRCRYYLPEATVRPRTERGNVPYQRWANEGWLTVTPGEVTDYDWIERDIRSDLAGYEIQAAGFDPWNATQIVGHLLDEGAPMVEVRQGPKTFHPPMKELERLLKSGRIDHGNDPVLAWMASNIVARRDQNDNMAPDKKNSHEKIDGIVALLMALGLSLSQEEEGVSVPDNYEVAVA
ncbi:terminase large subunit [Algiphilus sp.]|uniref:terminase large subunit n=1 Tax=Algiphilus sp. TaxID=1872431 RepID=UPI003CCBEB6A